MSIDGKTSKPFSARTLPLFSNPELNEISE
jgi:hypothetical protein